MNRSSSFENEYSFLPEDVRLEIIEHLMVLQMLQDVDLLQNCTYQLWRLVDRDELKEPICHPSLQFLSVIKDLILQRPPVGILWNCTGILWFLSRNHVCKALICSRSLGLLPLLLMLSQHHSPYQNHLINLFSNISLDPNNHDYLLTPDHQYFEMIRRVIHERPSYFQIYKCIAGFTKVVKNPEHIALMIAVGLPRLIVNQLLLSPANPEEWEGSLNGVAAWALSFTCSFSCHSLGAETLRQFNHPEYFLEIITYGNIQGLQAVMILSNLYFNDFHQEKNNRRNSNISNYRIILPKIIVRKRNDVDERFPLDFLLELLDVTIHYRYSQYFPRYNAWGYGYGIIQLREILITLRNLACSHVIIPHLIARRRQIAELAKNILTAYINNDEQFSALESSTFKFTSRGGGGGEDHDAIIALLELLLQINMYIPLTSPIAFLFRPALIKLEEVLKILHISTERKIPKVILDLANTLLQHFK